MIFPDWKSLEKLFHPEIFLLNGLLNKQMDFLILDNFNIALDKKKIVPAGGQGNKCM